MLKTMIVVASLMLAGVEAMGAPFDELFVRYEAQGSIYEVAFAQLGQSRATRPEVRAYAATLINDHEAYNGALRDLAESKGIAMPSSMTTSDKQRLDRLAAIRGTAFDSAFVREAVRINGEDIRAFRREASRTADPDIRSFVTRFLEVDEKHEAGARALGERHVGSSMSLIRPQRTGDTMPFIPPPGASAILVTLPPTPAPT
jgi:putative membrane protein